MPNVNDWIDNVRTQIFRHHGILEERDIDSYLIKCLRHEINEDKLKDFIRDIKGELNGPDSMYYSMKIYVSAHRQVQTFFADKHEVSPSVLRKRVNGS